MFLPKFLVKCKSFLVELMKTIPDPFKQKLKAKINNANCNDDLQSVIRHIDLDKLKQFLNHEIDEKSASNSRTIYFKSSSVIDICGNDIIKHCSTYLTVHELCYYQMTCKTFQSIHKTLL